ncbi:MAG: hypothetical protein LBC02_03640 [Planctomycetaceae bacterium]|jgi:hypothetical protein|nr:hypothetical protein [Planctomycetaceae bacterium]
MTNYKNKISPIPNPQKNCNKKTKLQKKCVDTFDDAPESVLTTKPTSWSDIPWNHAVFGGIHVGITQFVIGDASVRSINSNMNWETLYFLAKANDGNAATLP